VGVRRLGVGMLLGTGLVLVLCAPAASASVPHVIQPGETLWSVSAANNLTTRTVAAFNGLPEDTQVVVGQTVNVPTVDEGAATLASVPVDPAVAPVEPAPVETTPAPVEPATEAIAPAPGMGHIDSPWGQLHLDPAAAESWNAMADAAMQQFGVDLQPGGTVSAYRTYEQQAALYDQFLAGTGAPANPPGSSSHELGVAVDVATPEMRSVIDQIGGQFGWAGTIPSEWWHVEFVGG
jgi:murein DD-endopeptidase MepM/ murein hydrolase activator NlpD